MLESPVRRESAHILVVADGHQHRRLDQFVAAALAPEHSRSQIGRMIKAGLVTLNGTAVRASSAVRPGDRVEIISAVRAQPTVLPHFGTANAASEHVEVLFDDQELLAVNKPAGVPVHPSPGHLDSTLVNILMKRFPDLAAMAEPEGFLRPGIVHRLDKETSGVMVVARTPFARMALSHQFKQREVSKSYLAIVQGIVRQDRFMIDRPVGRHPTERKRMSTRSYKPREASTDFLVLHRFTAAPTPATLVRARPQTGRTHQIRVHLAARGHPCLGDNLYGGKSSPGWSRNGQALHALALTIRHPRRSERLEFVGPLPDDFHNFLTSAGFAIGVQTLRQWIDAE